MSIFHPFCNRMKKYYQNQAKINERKYIEMTKNSMTKNSCSDGTILRWLYLTIAEGIVDAVEVEGVDISSVTSSTPSINFSVVLKDGSKLNMAATIKR